MPTHTRPTEILVARKTRSTLENLQQTSWLLESASKRATKN